MRSLPNKNDSNLGGLLPSMNQVGQNISKSSCESKVSVRCCQLLFSVPSMFHGPCPHIQALDEGTQLYSFQTLARPSQPRSVSCSGCSLCSSGRRGKSNEIPRRFHTTTGISQRHCVLLLVYTTGKTYRSGLHRKAVFQVFVGIYACCSRCQRPEWVGPCSSYPFLAQ